MTSDLSVSQRSARVSRPSKPSRRGWFETARSLAGEVCTRAIARGMLSPIVILASTTDLVGGKLSDALLRGRARSEALVFPDIGMLLFSAEPCAVLAVAHEHLSDSIIATLRASLPEGESLLLCASEAGAISTRIVLAQAPQSSDSSPTLDGADSARPRNIELPV